MPFLTRDITTEREGLAVFAHQQIRQVATTLQGLDRDQLTAHPSASELSLAVLARHVLEVADAFVAQVQDATARSHSAQGTSDDSPPTALRSEHSEALSGGGMSAAHGEDTADSLREALETVATRLAVSLEDADLDAPVAVPEAPWLSGTEQWTVRWIALHSIEEFARHAGHADIIRESIDAKIAYELNALADGQPCLPTKCPPAQPASTSRR
ncbi:MULTISPECIES: DUF664 domain-containing protein [unclassified Brachybacterium]|uniref:mycothiol transferase n=1 Tax=unclassified Brachybacterium TaxID=2623841 RepID=UPI00360BD916